MDMMEQFRQTYLEESFEGLDVMEQGLLELPIGDPDLEEINTIFRAAHSIKGGSGTFGFNEIAGFTHVLETLLDELREGKRQVTQEAVDVMLQAVDTLRQMLTNLQNHEPIDEAQKNEVQAKLEAILNNGDVSQEAASEASTESQASSEPAGASQWKIQVIPDEDLLQTGNEPLRIFRELGQLGELEVQGDDSKLNVDTYQPENLYLKWDLTLKGEVEEDAIREVFEWIDGDGATIKLEKVSTGNNAQATSQPASEAKPETPKPAQETKPQATAKPAAKPAAKAGADAATQKKTEGSIRVNLSKIDQLVNLVGELVITQSMLSQFGEQAENNQDSDDWINKMKEGLTHLERHTRELQEAVMNIRMLPVSFAFNRMPRIVHDVSHKLGKKIELITEGENTELDKTMLEQLTDPLVHIVRNSIDHGIEMPEERLKKGKPETGRVWLSAYHQGGNIVIEIRDDGAGLNREKILNKAIEKGLIEPDAQLTDNEIYELLFLPGFSTADQVTDISGRGVGMDVVRRNIRALGGTVTVDSTPGEGSVFSIHLPLTLAILDGQLADVAGEVFVFPIVSIIESIQIDESRMKEIAGGSELYKLRDEYIPVIRLVDLFDLPAKEDNKNGLLVVVESAGHRAGILVDDLMGQQQVVIKSLETNFIKIPGIAGATILGDGTVSLIVDVGEVVENNESQNDAVKAA